MATRDYYIMSADIVVAKWENDELTVINNELLPLYLKRVHNANMWLETRAIDTHRANSRLLKKALRLKEKDDVSTVLWGRAKADPGNEHKNLTAVYQHEIAPRY